MGSESFNVVIIGAGKIGAFFDNPGSDKILTHAHAFTKHKGFSLIGFVDSDIEKAKEAVSVWGGRAFRNVSEAFVDRKIDVAIVAVPDDFHYHILKELSSFPVRTIFVEKPITKSVSEAEDVLRIFKKKDIGIVVNYTRRFMPELETIRSEIQKGVYGDYLTGTGYYGKGVLHNGSHLIDLLMFFMGEVNVLDPVSSVEDFYKDDHSVSAVLSFGKGQNFFLQYADCRNYMMFEIDMLFEKKRIRIYDLGSRIEEYDVLESKVFSGYRNIIRTSDYATSFKVAMYYAAENIYKNFTEGQALKCTAEDGYRVVKTCMAIKENV